MSDSERSLLGVQAVVDKSIVLHVYGVDDPGPEITVELVEVLQNRLNEAMLEVLSLLLSRNPKCKLTYSDVRVSFAHVIIFLIKINKTSALISVLCF